MLHRGKRSGLLIAATGSSQRAILLAGGNLAWASSSAAAERTNELVCRLDLATADGGRCSRARAARTPPADRRGADWLRDDRGVFSLRDIAIGAGLEACAFNTEEMLLGCLKLFDEISSSATLDPF